MVVNVPDLLLMKVLTAASKMGKLHSTTDVSTYRMEGKLLKMVTKVDVVAKGVLVEVLVEMVVKVVEDHLQKSKIS